MKKSKFSQFLVDNVVSIISEWAKFAEGYVPAAGKMDLKARCDHIEEMLATIAKDLGTPQTKSEQVSKSKGKNDSEVDTATAASAHGTDRAKFGFSPVDVVSEFRALRASILRLWSQEHDAVSREDFDEITRFNEAIDQLLVESMAQHGQDVDRSKDLFIGVLGHDLRNPLGAIMMSATAMKMQEGADWPHHKTASRILNAGTRMDALISDLVDFTRTRLGSGIPIQRAQTDLEELCRQTVDEFLAYHPQCNVRFEASGKLQGQWDAGRCGQLLSNLIGNALQHGSADCPVEVAVRGQADDVVLTVHNKGNRIPKADMARIFDPFKQLGSPSTTMSDARSFGLGLYIVQAIVTAHDGSIDVESTEQGTTFTVHLPRNAAATSTPA